MTVPDWRTHSKGTRIRVALWLHSEVGVDGTFTKQDLRDAFPSVEQIDRRMRDLRPEGWIIATYREDRSLSMDELRLVDEGGPVWEPCYVSRREQSVTDRERKEVLAADGFCCVFCGIGGGERYPDDQLRSARLRIVRIPPSEGGARKLLTCCERCHATSFQPTSAEALVSAIRNLADANRECLVSWIREGERQESPEQALWATYRVMPYSTRLEVAGLLDIDVADRSHAQ